MDSYRLSVLQTIAILMFFCMSIKFLIFDRNIIYFIGSFCMMIIAFYVKLALVCVVLILILKSSNELISIGYGVRIVQPYYTLAILIYQLLILIFSLFGLEVESFYKHVSEIIQLWMAFLMMLYIRERYKLGIFKAIVLGLLACIIM